MRGAWRPAVRMAWRDIARHRARSLVIVLMVGLPVMLSGAVATFVATDDVSLAERLPVELGAAEARVQWAGGPVRQDREATGYGTDGESIERTASQVERDAAGLADGPVLRMDRVGARVVVGSRAWSVGSVRTDLADPLARGLVTVDEGRLPVAADEVLVTGALADDGATIDSTVTVDGRRLTVVGVGPIQTAGVDPGHRGVALPASSTVPASQGDPRDLELLVGGRPITAAQVPAWNRAGFVVLSRHVVDHPDEGDADGVFESGATYSGDEQLVPLVAVALVIEVVLLAGPAFAVGVRRQRRELALVAAAGGSAGDLRRVVLAQALVLGLVASIGGALLAVPVARLGLAAATSGWGVAVGPFDVVWSALPAAAVLGVVACLAAAVVPARQVARQDVVGALAGRQPDTAPRRGWPLAGALLLTIGTASSLRAGRGVDDGFANAWWAIVSVVGAVMLTPWIISLLGRLATRLPLPLRLAARDADRHRSRSAPAVAAIMASICAVTALAIGSSSDAEQNRRQQQYAAPVGTVTLSAGNGALDDVVEQVARKTGVRFVALDRLGADGQAFVWRTDPGGTGESMSVSSAPVVVADADTLRAAGVELTSAEAAALETGSMLFAAPLSDIDTSIHVTDEDDPEDEKTVELPVVETPLTTGTAPSGPAPVIAGAVISPETAATLDLPVVSTTAVSTRLADSMDVAEVRGAVLAADPLGGDVDVQREQESSYAPIFTLLAICGGLAVLIGTFTATGLTLADARNDLDTLSAVGAPPRTRRLVAGATALMLSFVGSALGIAVGFTPGLASTWALTGDGTTRIVDVPWLLLGLLLVAVPAVAGAVTTAVTRGSRPITRRVTP